MTSETAADIRDETHTPEVLSTRKVYDGRVWDVVSETFRYGDAEITRDYVAHTGAVAAVAVDDDDRVLMIQQYRHPIRARDWELPAGLLDVAGEELQTAVARELAEEADIEASEWTHLLSAHTTPGGSDEIIHLYLARGLRATETPFARDEEEADIRIAWVPLDDACDMILRGELHNGPLIMGILAAQRLLRRE